MADRLPISSTPEPRGLERAHGGGAARNGVRTGAAFRALLERLEDQAAGLRQKSEEIEKPEELAEAVDQARESLADALSLRDRLLEAWRAARHGGASAEER